MKKRNLITMLILSIVTFGIYTIVWQCMFQDELKRETGEGFSGVAHFFMCILTFGIYAIYWQYACGQRLAKLGAPNNSVLYLVIALLSFTFISMFLQQADANKVAKY